MSLKNISLVSEGMKSCHPVKSFRWRDASNAFLSTLKQLLQTNCNVLQSALETGVDSHVQLITFIYQEAGQCMLCKFHYFSTQPPWWDDECDRLKLVKYNALHKFRCSNSASDLRGYKDRRNSFKTYFRQKECDYQSNNRQELVNSLDNPSSFWKILKRCKSVILLMIAYRVKNGCNISMAFCLM